MCVEVLSARVCGGVEYMCVEVCVWRCVEVLSACVCGGVWRC